MHSASHKALIQKFYSCLAARDAAGMAACYHPDVLFSDPVFVDLRGARARGMWRMLCERGVDLEIEASGIAADEQAGRAHWEAWYTYSATGRRVHNSIDARFIFRDSLIAEHRDHFDLWAWASQALGMPGRLLGWAPPFQNAIRRRAGAALDGFLAK
ncbi:MAG TPA: nuclear transport factor 2 family protein [Thermoanaerobaculia bacterium]|nr:nuclear transport factor 2 family protein [Thermoanaerobaculia bacterium]